MKWAIQLGPMRMLIPRDFVPEFLVGQEIDESSCDKLGGMTLQPSYFEVHEGYQASEP